MLISPAGTPAGQNTVSRLTTAPVSIKVHLHGPSCAFWPAALALIPSLSLDTRSWPAVPPSLEKVARVEETTLQLGLSWHQGCPHPMSLTCRGV